MLDWLLALFKSVDANTITALAAVITVPVSLYIFHKSQESQQTQSQLLRQEENNARQEHWENLARDEILAQASTSLEYAFNTLTASGTQIPPEQNRLNWLTAARHLIRYRALQRRLSGIQQEICAEREEFWRHRFYLALRALETKFGYFERVPGHTEESSAKSIVPKSALVVLAFAEWPADLEDPLDSISEAEILKGRETLLNRHRAFERVYEQSKDCVTPLQRSTKYSPDVHAS